MVNLPLNFLPQNHLLILTTIDSFFWSVLGLHKADIILYVFYCVWPPLHNMMFVGFMHVGECINSLFLLIVEWDSIVWNVSIFQTNP